MLKKRSNYFKTLPLLYAGVMLVAVITSCASLTQTQVNLVHTLAVSSDTITNTPASIFRELEQVRTGRGLFYAASLTTAHAHYREVSALAQNKSQSIAEAKNAMAYIMALNSYTRALRSISNNARWKSVGTEIRGVGNKTDSLFMAVNSTGYLDNTLPEDAWKLAGQSVAFLAESYMKVRRTKVVKSFVIESDSLVAACVESLIDVLRSPSLDALLEHETVSLENDYRAYLDAVALKGQLIPMSYDERYIELRNSLNSAKYARTRCVISLRAFARAHHKLSLCLENPGRRVSNERLFDLYKAIIQMNTLTGKITDYIETI